MPQYVIAYRARGAFGLFAENQRVWSGEHDGNAVQRKSNDQGESLVKIEHQMTHSHLLYELEISVGVNVGR